jgi:hypothetical protein
MDDFGDDESARKPTRAGRNRSAAASTGGMPKWVVYALGGYALLMTVLAIYGLLIKSGDKLPSDHPLSTIPDNFGEFPATERKKVSQFKNLDGELPGNLKAELGGTIQVGQLEVTPLEIEKRRLNIVKEVKGAAERLMSTSSQAALVLQLRVKNTSPDSSIFPLDPAFTRRAKGDDKPPTRLIVGSRVFAGGAISWPFNERLVKREYEEKQEQDATALKPGETRDYIVFTVGDDANLARTVRATKEPLLWRVQLRRGLIEFRGKDLPVTAIIGVEFKATDVKKLDE